MPSGNCVSAMITDDNREFLESTEALARNAIARWDLEVASIEPIKVRENAVFRITTTEGGRAALRVHRQGYHSDAALRSEFEWMRALEAAGIPVPQVILSRAGREFELDEAPGLEGVRQIDLFRWIEGRQLGSVGPGIGGDPMVRVGQYRTIGAIMARIHNQSAAWAIPAGFVRHSWDSGGLVGEQPRWGRFWDLAALKHAERRLLLETRAALSVDLAAYGTGPDRYGLIHGDLVPENVMVDGAVMRVIDFDDAGFGWHLFDIATSLYFLTGERFYPALRAALLEGYRSERSLSDEAVAHLQVFMTARATTYLGWVHTRQNSETAREFTAYLIDRACAIAAEYLKARMRDNP
jgi:Ser/Thr protein kinase RdoA (MazF antagonist)